MILLFPLVLAGVVVACRFHGGAGEGGRWFWAWACFGALLVFAFLTGLSVGLFLLPLVAVVGFAVARRASGWHEALGAVAGGAAVVGALAGLNGWSAALALSAAVALVAFAAATRAGLRT